MGIGGVPDAVLNALHQRRGLRVWTEMFSDGVLALDRAGALDPDAVLALLADDPFQQRGIVASVEVRGWTPVLGAWLSVVDA